MHSKIINYENMTLPVIRHHENFPDNNFQQLFFFLKPILLLLVAIMRMCLHDIVLNFADIKRRFKS